MSTKDPKTLFAVRLDRNKFGFWKELWDMTRVIFCFGLIIIMMGACQVYFCQQKNVSYTIAQCLKRGS